MRKYWWLILSILVVAGLLIFLRGNEDVWIKDDSGNWVMHGNPTIHDFETCAKKYPVMETYPEQCRLPNGPTFTEKY